MFLFRINIKTTLMGVLKKTKQAKEYFVIN